MIEFVKKRLSGRYYLQNALILTIGSTLAQAVPIAISPILTRLYSPEDFAVFALYMAISSVFAVVATGRYELAVVLPETEEDAVNIVVLSLTIAIILSLSSLIFLIFFKESVTIILKNKDVGNWLLLIPVSILVTGTFRTLNCWANRKSSYMKMSAVKVVQAGTTASVNISGGVIGPSGGWLIWGMLAGHGAGAVLLALKMWKDLNFSKAVSKKRILFNAKKYSDFPKINSLHAFIDIIQSSGIIFLISYYFGGIALGYYAITVRVLKAPVGLVGSSIAQVFYQRAAKANNDNKDLYGLLIVTTKKLAFISLPFFAFLMVVSPDLFAFVFGPEWREAGVYARLLTPWIAIHFIVMPVTQLPIILNRQKEAFWFGLFGNSIMFFSIVYGGNVGDIEKGLMALSVGMVLYLSLYFAWLCKIAKGRRCCVSNSSI